MERQTPPVAPRQTALTSPRMHFFGFGKSIHQAEKRHNLHPDLLSYWRTARRISRVIPEQSPLGHPENAAHTMKPVTGPDFDSHELIPAVAQDAETGDVLMMAWMNRESWQETLRTGKVCYYSRSRKKLWRKGEESGNVQELLSAWFDCDGDTLLLKVRQIGGAACHEGFRSCFFRRVIPETGSFAVEGQQVFDPKSVYKR